jgi:hypothetical protein
MSVKRYKLAMPTSSQRIRKAKASFQQMSQLKKIELMVQAKAMTEIEAARAKKKLADAAS